MTTLPFITRRCTQQQFLLRPDEETNNAFIYCLAVAADLLACIDGYPVHDLHEKVLARVERPLFDLVLAHTGGNQLKAAEIPGLNRNTLRKKLADLGMQAKKKRAGREDRALDGD